MPLERRIMVAKPEVEREMGSAGKIIILTALTFSLLWLTSAGTAGQSSGEAADLSYAHPSSKLAEEVYDNIEVFRGVPYGELIPTMQLVSEMLGVQCEFCHAEDNRAEEGIPQKQISRRMFQMVATINRESFGGRTVVTCYTCHRGVPLTETMPDWESVLGRSRGDAVQQADGVAVRSDSAPSDRKPDETPLPTVDEVLARYIEALGGADALGEIKTRIERGTVTSTRPNQPPVTLPIEAIAVSPDKRYTKSYSVSHLGNSSRAYGVYNGDAGWMREGSGPTRIMFGWRRDAARLEDTLNFPMNVKKFIRQLRVNRATSIDGEDVYVVSGSTEYLPEVELYFGKNTALLRRIEYYTNTVVGIFPSRIDYSDYRDVEGVLIPHQWDVAVVRGVRARYQINDVRQNGEVPETNFLLPTPLPSLYR